jgi:hypothetical protein
MTAVEWLAEELTLPEYGNNPQWVLQVIQQAKEMEKQQIINTYRDGRSDQQSEKPSRFYNRMAEQYYTETLNQNKMKTAVEWLFDNLDLSGGSEAIEMLEQAKEMEKEQIERAFNESRLTHPMIGFKHETFEQYYNETFKTK